MTNTGTLALNRFLVIAVALGLSACGKTSAPRPPERTIPLPNVKGRIDHFTIDLLNERLFVCALGNDSVEVIDLRNGERVRTHLWPELVADACGCSVAEFLYVAEALCANS